MLLDMTVVLVCPIKSQLQQFKTSINKNTLKFIYKHEEHFNCKIFQFLNVNVCLQVTKSTTFVGNVLPSFGLNILSRHFTVQFQPCILKCRNTPKNTLRC